MYNNMFLLLFFFFSIATHTSDSNLQILQCCQVLYASCIIICYCATLLVVTEISFTYFILFLPFFKVTDTHQLLIPLYHLTTSPCSLLKSATDYIGLASPFTTYVEQITACFNLLISELGLFSFSSRKDLKLICNTFMIHLCLSLQPTTCVH